MRVWRRRNIGASPEAIWHVISTVESIPLWQPGVQSADLLPGAKEGLGRRQELQKLLYHRNIDIEQEVVWWDPGHLLGMRHVRESIAGRELRSLKDFTMALSINPSEGGESRVVAEYTWDPGGPMAWFLSLLFAGRTMGRELGDSLAKIDRLVTGKGSSS